MAAHLKIKVEMAHPNHQGLDDTSGRSSHGDVSSTGGCASQDKGQDGASEAEGQGQGRDGASSSNGDAASVA